MKVANKELAAVLEEISKRKNNIIKTNIKMDVITKFEPIFDRDTYKYPYVSLPGGRYSTKSWTVAYYAIRRALQQNVRVLCTRYFKVSIKKSFYTTLVDVIKRTKVTNKFHITDTSIKCKTTGSEFLFEGLHLNTDNIRSVEGVDICIVEEAANVSNESWDILLPTIRKPGSEIIIIFNPKHETDATFLRWVKNPLPGTLVIPSTWKDNPWLSQKEIDAANHMKETDYNNYLHVFEGQPVLSSEDSIFEPKWFDACIDAHLRLNLKPEGVKVLGFDPASTGTDTKAACLRHGNIITQMSHWTSGDLQDGLNKVWDVVIDNNVTHVVFDGVGVGDGIGALFEHKITAFDYKLNLRVFKGGNAVDYPNHQYDLRQTNKETFKNLKAQYVWQLRQMMMNTFRAVTLNEYIDPTKLISISSSIDCLDDLKYELCSMKQVPYSDKIQIQSKKDSKADGFKSPGLFDSLYMSLANNQTNIEPVPDFYTEPDYNFESNSEDAWMI